MRPEVLQRPDRYGSPVHLGEMFMLRKNGVETHCSRNRAARVAAQQCRKVLLTQRPGAFQDVHHSRILALRCEFQPGE